MAVGVKTMKSAARSEISAQDVAQVAYELYERRGRVDGHDFEDWLQAEVIVRRRAVAGRN